jgi:F0F1-type ATP synthase assembly protein I
MSSIGEPRQADQSLAELVGTMSQDISTLMRKEVELAKEELRAEAKQAGKAGQGFAGAAVAALYTGVALVLTLGFALDTALPTWAAFLIVTIVFAGVAAVLAQWGRTELKRVDPKPEETIATLKEDAQWLNEQRN